MNIHDDLDIEWADIDSEGLVRVLHTESFREGFVFVAHIGQAAEAVEYFPEIVLNERKVTITIPAHDDGLDHRLAHAIDVAIADAHA